MINTILAIGPSALCFCIIRKTRRYHISFRHLTFSSGCIRVEKPLELAELLLNNPKEWNAAKITEIINSKQTAKIFLPEPMPVLLLYWTVAVDEDDTVEEKTCI